MRKVRLTKIRDVRRLLSRIVNQVIAGELETNKANCIGQLCNIMLRAMEKSELEQRVDALEKNFKSKAEDKEIDNYEYRKES